MRVLLDECLPRRLRRELPGHTVLTVASVGWAGLANGALLRRAAETFDVFVTADSSMTFQQNPADLRIAVVILAAHHNNSEALKRLMPEVQRLLPSLRRGSVVRVG